MRSVCLYLVCAGISSWSQLAAQRCLSQSQNQPDGDSCVPAGESQDCHRQAGVTQGRGCTRVIASSLSLAIFLLAIPLSFPLCAVILFSVAVINHAHVFSFSPELLTRHQPGHQPGHRHQLGHRLELYSGTDDYRTFTTKSLNFPKSGNYS